MANQFGPWATSIEIGGRPQLSAFWRRRMSMLVRASQTSSVPSGRTVLCLALLSALTIAFPIVRVTLAAPAEDSHSLTPVSVPAKQGDIVTPPSLEELKEGIEKHYHSYSDYEFVYNVKSKISKAKYERTQNTYRLHVPEKGYPWQYLVQRKRDPMDNTLQVEHFIVFNGKQSWEYFRSESIGKRSKCVKVAGYHWQPFMDDHYSQLLVKSIVGLPFTTLSDRGYKKFWEQTQTALRFAHNETLDKHDVFVFKRSPSKDKEWELHFFGQPNAMIVGAQAIKTDNRKVLELWDVEKIGQKKGIVFPEKGHIFRKGDHYGQDKRGINAIDYSYDVIKVRHLDKVAQAEWFPEIPPGTTVVDQVTGKNFSTPWSKQQRKAIEEARKLK